MHRAVLIDWLIDLFKDDYALFQGEVILSEFSKTQGGCSEGKHIGSWSQLSRPGDGQTYRVLRNSADPSVQPEPQSTGKGYSSF